MLVRTILTLLVLAAPLFAADPPLPEGAFARLGSPEWRYLTDGRANLVFSPDGSGVVTKVSDVIRLVDFETGRERWRVDGFYSEASFVPLPKGQLLIGTYNVLRIFDLASGKEQRRVSIEVPFNRTPVSDGKLVAIHDAFGPTLGATVVFDLETGKERWRQGGNQTGVCYPLGFVRDRSELVMRVFRHPDSWIRVVDADTQKTVREWKVDPKRPVVLSPDGKWICLGGDAKVRILDVSTGKERCALSGHADAVPIAVFASDCKKLATAGKDRKLLSWDLTTEKEIGRINFDKSADLLAISPDGGRLVAACGGSNALHRFDLKAGRELPMPDGHTHRIEQIAFLADRKKLLTASLDGAVRVWDLQTRRTVRSWTPKHLSLNWLAVSGDGKIAATAGYNDAVIRLWDIATGKEIRSFKPPVRAVGCVAFAPNGTDLMASGFDTSPKASKIWIWNAAAAVIIKEIPSYIGGANGISFMPDQQNFVSTPGDLAMSLGITANTPLSAQITNLATRQVRALNGRIDNVAVASVDGRSIAVVRQPVGESKLVLVETASGQERLTFDCNPAGFRPLGFSGDGRLLVTPNSYSPGQSHRDSGVVIHDTATGKELRRFEAGDISTFEISPDGKTLASGGMDGTVLLWDLSKVKAPEVNAKLNPDKLWADLLADAPRAYQAIVAVGAGGEEGAELLRERLKPAVPLDPAHVAKQLDDLESPQFAVRQKAAARLASFDERVASALRARLKTTTLAEARKTISHLLEQLDGWLTQPQVLREVRAVEAMERNDSPAARQLLEEWVKGDQMARLTREAKAGLKWKGRPSAKRGK